MNVCMSLLHSNEAETEFVEWPECDETAEVGPLSFAVPLVHAYFLVGCWIYGMASGSYLTCMAWMVLPIAVLAIEVAGYASLSRLRLDH